MRELCLEQFVAEIYEDSRKNEDSKYVFFLGAGCSKSSGIPLARELAEEWYEELAKQKIKFNVFNKDNNILNIKDEDIGYATLYFKIFETLFPSPLAQQKEIQSRTENVIPALGYYVLADLMKEPSFNTVVTTNFDNLIQDAIIFSSSKRALVITHQDLARFIERNNTPLIVKVHGDAHMHPHNSENGIQEIPKELKSAIQSLFINAKVVCIGYGGNDKSIANLLEGCDRVDQVYWLNGSQPNNVEVKKWWENLSNKTFIEEYDFDKIMHSIRRKFDIKKPNFQTLVNDLESSYEQGRNGDIKTIEEIKNKNYDDYILLADSFLDKSEYEQAKEFYLDALKLEENNFYPNAMLGYIYRILGSDIDTNKFYTKALSIEPNHAKVNGNYATFLAHNIKDYGKAELHYKLALGIDPNNEYLNGNYAGFLFFRERVIEAEKYLSRAYTLNVNKNLEVELEFYRLAHLEDSFEDAKAKLDDLLSQGYESKDWDFSQNIERAIKDKHKHIPDLKEYATKISGLSYDNV